MDQSILRYLGSSRTWRLGVSGHRFPGFEELPVGLDTLDLLLFALPGDQEFSGESPFIQDFVLMHYLCQRCQNFATSDGVGR